MDEARRLLGLAWPVVVGQVGLVLMNLVDLVMIGPLGRDATAAVGLGATWTFSAVIVGLGSATGMDPLVTQAYGAGRPSDAGLAAARGLVLVGLMSLPIMLVHALAGPGLTWLGQPPEAIAGAATYSTILALSVPPMLAFAVVRQLLQGGGVMRPAMWVVGLGNLVNIVGNWLLIEPLGVAGVAWSTAVVRWLMLAGLIALGWPVLQRARPEGRILDLQRLGALASLALPVGLQVALEVWAFNLATFLAGWLGASAVAAHTASLNAAATAFMVPMGISAAAATRVGNLVGAGADWRRAAATAIAIGAGAMTLSGALFLLVPEAIGRAYNPDPEVIALVASTLPIGALFGGFDGVQVVAFGVLRGLGDTRRPALFNLLGYWVIGLPLGGFLALRLGFGLPGVWLGLTVALGVVAALLLARIGALARTHSSVVGSGSVTGTRRTSR